jgi:hypothetical protein
MGRHRSLHLASLACSAGSQRLRIQLSVSATSMWLLVLCVRDSNMLLTWRLTVCVVVCVSCLQCHTD